MKVELLGMLWCGDESGMVEVVVDGMVDGW